MIKVLGRPTNNAEPFYEPTKGGKFKCEHRTKFCAGLHEIFGFHGFNLSSFVICFQCHRVFEKILKYVNYVRNFNKAKLRKPLSK